MLESVLYKRRNSRGRPFQTDGPLTQKGVVRWAAVCRTEERGCGVKDGRSEDRGAVVE